MEKEAIVIDDGITLSEEERLKKIEEEEDKGEEDEEEEIEYEIEDIIKHRMRGGIIEYRIKWLGYPSSQNTWEPEENLQNAPEKLALYWQRIEEERMPKPVVEKKKFVPKEIPKPAVHRKKKVNVIGITLDNNSNDKYSYLIQRGNDEKNTIVSSSYMKDNYPYETLEFLENNLFINSIKLSKFIAK